MRGQHRSHDRRRAAAALARPACSLLALLVAAAWLAPRGAAYQLLFFPLSERTHMLVHLKLATELAARNHTVYFMTADCHAAFARDTAASMAAPARPALRWVPYAMDCAHHEAEKAAARRLGRVREALAILGNVFGRADAMLGDAALMSQLAALAPSTHLVVADILSYGMLLAAKLGLPHVDLDVGTAGSLWEPVFYGAEPASSFVPALGTLFPTTGLSLAQRAVNLAVNKAARGLLAHAYWSPTGGLQRLVAKHGVPLAWPYTAPLLLLTNSNWATEPPRAVPPNTQYVGPILPEPAAQLAPGPLADFVAAAQRDAAPLVLVSFGGTLEAPLEAAATLAAVVAATPQARFVWKLPPRHVAALAAAGADVRALANAHVAEWLPQNDLLGQPGVRAFVSQGGYLSMGEAAFHGVPVLGLPFIPGQGELIRFAADQGRALALPGDTLAARRAEPFRAALLRLLDEPGFAAAAAVTAARLRAAPRPFKALAADWVEYAAAVRQHGPFLHPAKLRQRWHEQAMLDVLAVYVLLALPLLLLVRRAAWLAHWRLRAWAGRWLRGSDVVARVVLRPAAGEDKKDA